LTIYLGEKSAVMAGGRNGGVGWTLYLGGRYAGMAGDSKWGRRRPLYLGARSAGMAGGRKGGLGFTLSTIGSSTTRVSSFPGQLDCGPDKEF
jgi:hypothetical protein